MTGKPVAAGSHQLRAQFACTTGAADGMATSANFAGVVTVLTAAPALSTSATATFETESVGSDPPVMCTVDAAGTKVCSEG